MTETLTEWKERLQSLTRRSDQLGAQLEEAKLACQQTVRDLERIQKDIRETKAEARKELK